MPARRFLKRTRESSKAIQAYCASKYDSHVVVDGLLGFTKAILDWTERGEDGSGKA